MKLSISGMFESKTDLTNVTLFVLLVVAVFSPSMFSQDIEKEPQRIVNTIPAKVPIQVEFVNGGMKSALDDIEIRITNTGKKSICYLSVSISSEKDFAYRLGVGFSSFRIGNGRLSNFSQPIEALAAERDETTPLEPGGKASFRMKKQEAELSWKLMMDYGYPRDSRLKLYLTFLRFGDGSGYATPQAEEMPNPRPRM